MAEQRHLEMQSKTASPVDEDDSHQMKGIKRQVSSTLFVDNPMAKIAQFQQKRTSESEFHLFASEVTKLSSFEPLEDRDLDAIFSLRDWFSYKFECVVSADVNMRLYLLVGSTAVILVAFTGFWTAVRHNDTIESSTSENFMDALFFTFNILTTGNAVLDIEAAGERAIFAAGITFGIFIIAILIGIVTDTVSGAMESLDAGTSKVIEEGHTLILGWNESTPRLLRQVAFLRRIWRQQNETLPRRLFFWLRVPPSSPVAKHKVVILNNQISKKEMESIVRLFFAEANIRQAHTKIGRDVIFRVGDPTSTHELIRVAAHKATSIAVMMTAADLEESAFSHGRIANSASVRTLLALRNLVYSNWNKHGSTTGEKGDLNGLRIVIQLQQSCPFIESAAIFAPSGRQIVYPLDLNKFINSLMFKSASKPGLARVVADLLDFEHSAIRCRRAYQIYGGRANKRGFFVGKSFRESMLTHHWAGGVLIGVDPADKRPAAGYDSPTSSGEAQGIVSHPERVISAMDWIIFVSHTSNPQCSQSPTDLADFGLKAKLLLEAGEGKKPAASGATSSSADSSLTSPKQSMGRARRLSATDFGASDPTPRHVLLFGWRPEWDSEAGAFRNRVRQVCEDLPLGSTVTCLNVTKQVDFHALLTTAVAGDDGSGIAWPVDAVAAAQSNFSSGWYIREEEGYRTFVVKHFCGDPVQYESVSSLLASPLSPAFDVAICLGNVVGSNNIPARSRDSRVLSMLLILRQLTDSCPKWENKSMHVVAEAQMDQTEHLAVVPKRLAGTGDKKEPMGVAKRAEHEASVEPWAQPVPILPRPEFSAASVGAATLQPCARFSFRACLLVRRPGMQPALFYELKDGRGWVHDASATNPGRRAIKVHLVKATDGANRTPEPDFVNSKAIIARAVAMNLAYPQIEDSVTELVSTATGTPEVELYPPSVLGVPPGVSVAFGVVQHILDGLYDGFAVAIGYMRASSGLVLSPPLGHTEEWTENDRFVVILRHSPLQVVKGSGLDGDEKRKAQRRYTMQAMSSNAGLKGQPATLESFQKKIDEALRQLETLKASVEKASVQKD